MRSHTEVTETPENTAPEGVKPARPGFRLVPCVGEAHANAYIDNCGLCAPRWGWVEEPIAPIPEVLPGETYPRWVERTRGVTPAPAPAPAPERRYPSVGDEVEVSVLRDGLFRWERRRVVDRHPENDGAFWVEGMTDCAPFTPDRDGPGWRWPTDGIRRCGTVDCGAILGPIRCTRCTGGNCARCCGSAEHEMTRDGYVFARGGAADGLTYAVICIGPGVWVGEARARGERPVQCPAPSSEAAMSEVFAYLDSQRKASPLARHPGIFSLRTDAGVPALAPDDFDPGPVLDVLEAAEVAGVGELVEVAERLWFELIQRASAADVLALGEARRRFDAGLAEVVAAFERGGGR